MELYQFIDHFIKKTLGIQARFLRDIPGGFSLEIHGTISEAYSNEFFVFLVASFWMNVLDTSYTIIIESNGFLKKTMAGFLKKFSEIYQKEFLAEFLNISWKTV